MSDLAAGGAARANLRGRDLTEVEGLLPEHLAGADLTGAKLPERIEKFPALDHVAAISRRSPQDLHRPARGLRILLAGDRHHDGCCADPQYRELAASDHQHADPDCRLLLGCRYHPHRSLRPSPLLLAAPMADPRHPARGLPGWRRAGRQGRPRLLTGLVRTYMPRTPARPTGIRRERGLRFAGLVARALHTVLLLVAAPSCPSH